jgi:hypothetical protein
MHLRMKVIATAVALSCGGLSVRAGAPQIDGTGRPAAVNPWAFAFESGQLFGINNPRDYHLAPQILSLIYSPKKRWSFTRFDLRSEFLFSLIAEPVLHGPENNYFAGAVRRRWTISPYGKGWSIYLDAGFGAGAIDSTSDPYGQGQDLTFTFLISSGLDLALTDTLHLTLSAFYQHLSNGGLSEPERENVGLDAFGPAIGLLWRF